MRYHQHRRGVTAHYSRKGCRRQRQTRRPGIDDATELLIREKPLMLPLYYSGTGGGMRSAPKWQIFVCVCIWPEVCARTARMQSLNWAIIWPVPLSQTASDMTASTHTQQSACGQVHPRRRLYMATSTVTTKCHTHTHTPPTRKTLKYELYANDMCTCVFVEMRFINAFVIEF